MWSNLSFLLGMWDISWFVEVWFFHFQMSDYLPGQGLLGAFGCVMLKIFSVLCEYFNDFCVVL